MGASVYYQQVKPADREQLWTPAPSSFLRSLADAFGEGPSWELDDESIPILVGMSIIGGGGGDNPYAQLIAAIRELGTVKVWSEP